MSAENRYEVAARALLAEHDVTVVGWRSSTTGHARTDGSRTIVAPLPRGPVSFQVLAHEVGHIVLHTKNGRTPRWVEEVEATEFALAQMERFGFAVSESLYAKAARHLAYSFAKAVRRGADPDAIAARFPIWWEDALRHEKHEGLLRALRLRGH
jgi:hypothetical protein